MYDVTDFDVMSCCNYCGRRAKAVAVIHVIKMATLEATEEITLIDAEDNETYTVLLSVEDAARAHKDIQFASTLLAQAKSSKESVVESPDRTSTNLAFNSNKENEDIANNKEQHNWSKQETLLLIDIYQSKENDFCSGKHTVKQCWESVAKEMQKKGYNINARKCTIKFQAMKKTYKSIKDHNKKSGNNTKKWEYFDVLLFLHNYA